MLSIAFCAAARVAKDRGHHLPVATVMTQKRPSCSTILYICFLLVTCHLPSGFAPLSLLFVVVSFGFVLIWQFVTLWQYRPRCKQAAKGKHKGKPIYGNFYCKSSKDRGKIRSKTFSGIAKAMAEQWGQLKKEAGK